MALSLISRTKNQPFLFAHAPAARSPLSLKTRRPLDVAPSPTPSSTYRYKSVVSRRRRRRRRELAHTSSSILYSSFPVQNRLRPANHSRQQERQKGVQLWEESRSQPAGFLIISSFDSTTYAFHSLEFEAIRASESTEEEKRPVQYTD